MEFFQEHRSFYNSLLSSRKLWHTRDMVTLTAYAFFSEVELYQLANANLKKIRMSRKIAFVEHYHKWLIGYQQKIEQPFLIQMVLHFWKERWLFPCIRGAEMI